MWDDDSWMDELTCWERLEAEEFGRMAFHLVDEVHIVPINYVARKPQLIFRTTAGSKLLAVEMNADMAFEIDRVDDEAGHAWSVVARGCAKILEGDAAREAAALDLRPWLGAEGKHRYVALAVESVTGRQYDLKRAPAGS